MSLFVGDNFKYGGRKFLDDRQSFNSLEEMKNFTKVPEGFVTYCKETGKRYEYKSSNTIDELTGPWAEYSVSASFDGDIFHIGTSMPSDKNDLWFDPGVQGTTSDITMDNPIIMELFSCIATMQKQILDLQEEVEYLKLHGGGGSRPENPDTPDIPVVSDLYLSLEDGGLFELEEGGFLLAEEEAIIIQPSVSIIMLEDGGFFELEEGGFLLTEQQETATVSSTVLLENGSNLLLENGNLILLETN